MDLDEGMEPEKFKDFLHKFLNFRYDQIKNTWEVLGAMEFEYTYWAAPRNRTAVVQNFIDVSTSTLKEDPKDFFHIGFKKPQYFSEYHNRARQIA